MLSPNRETILMEAEILARKGIIIKIKISSLNLHYRHGMIFFTLSICSKHIISIIHVREIIGLIGADTLHNTEQVKNHQENFSLLHMTLI